MAMDFILIEKIRIKKCINSLISALNFSVISAYFLKYYRKTTGFVRKIFNLYICAQLKRKTIL